MVNVDHENCGGFCRELSEEVKALENQTSNGSVTIAHAIFSVGTVIVQVLEEIAYSQARIAKVMEKQAGVKQRDHVEAKDAES